jgi:hypothetical protein
VIQIDATLENDVTFSVRKVEPSALLMQRTITHAVAS